MLEIRHHQPRPLALGQLHQPFYLGHARRERQARRLVVVVPVVGVLAIYGHVRARPVHYAHLYALPLGRQPYGLAAVKRAVLARGGVADAERAARGRVVKAVGYYAVAVGHEAGGQRIVVGERLRRERRAHHRAYALAPQRVEERRVVHQRIVPAEAVERYEYRVMPSGHGVDCRHEQQQEYRFSHCCSVV